MSSCIAWMSHNFVVTLKILWNIYYPMPKEISRKMWMFPRLGKEPMRMPDAAKQTNA